MAEKSIVARLRADHQQVEKLFGRISGATGKGLEELFCELTNELVRHEVAEETIVYPVVRQMVPNGERLADARIKEQAEAEQLLSEMEKEGTDSKTFSGHLEKLQKAVLEHAGKEEELVFAPLDEKLDNDRKNQLGDVYERAKAGAPTHPHPHAPDTPPGNLVAGPVAAIVDRTRDAMQKVAG